MSVKKIIQFIKQSRKQKMDNFKQALTVLPKNKIHIINLSLHLGPCNLALTKFQVSDRTFLLFCNCWIYI
jgi:hypothetical protein